MKCTRDNMHPGQVVRLLDQQTFWGDKVLLIPRGRIVLLVSEMTYEGTVSFGEFLVSKGVVRLHVTPLPLDQVFEIVG